MDNKGIEVREVDKNGRKILYAKSFFSLVITYFSFSVFFLLLSYLIAYTSGENQVIG